MATLVLSSVGKLFGPIGQIAGTLIGNAIDNEIFAPGDIEGARLKELAVTGSSYGTPIPRQYGAMRIPGTIIWSTDLKEHRDKQSSGKGQPKIVSYSYSVSFAVALSSRPIDRINRIWADGNLLRGSAGDLKSSGTLRVYNGHGDQMRDPLLEAELGSQCPAFRNRAYAVFEDLDLTDFGNRIPSLSFEVFAGEASAIVSGLLSDLHDEHHADAPFPQLRGFGHEGGSVRNVLSAIDHLQPLYPTVGTSGVSIDGAADLPAAIHQLPMPSGWENGDFGQQSGTMSARYQSGRKALSGLRYYDPARDYQPAVQHADPGEERSRTFQFPGVFTAADALELARAANLRSQVRSEKVFWRCCELDPQIGPGSLVQLPDDTAAYIVASWEWREGGVELELERYRLPSVSNTAADAGVSWAPLDRLASQTQLRVFELPWDGFGDASMPVAYAAPDAGSGLWPGCTLHAEREGALVPLGLDARARAVTGHLTQALLPSIALRFEPNATAFVQLVNADADLPSTDLRGLAQGENRVLIGPEIIQYLTAIALGNGAFAIKGLLRGRGGTEHDAQSAHDPLTAFTLLDERLIPLGPDTLASSTGTFAALGLRDEEPATALLETPGRYLRPLTPVHASGRRDDFGHVRIAWIRRARGQWFWYDEAQVPLVEESEAYEVGCGPTSAPYQTWQSETAQLTIQGPELLSLQANYGIETVWVRQVGTFAKSDPIAIPIPA